jgi:hypothetical protein
VDWVHLAQDRDQWPALVHTEINLRLEWSAEKFGGSEILIGPVIESTIFWDITPCSPVKISQRFGGTYRLHLRGRRSRGRYQRESRWQAS